MTHPRQLRSSFGRAASAYARHRRDYALAAIEWALEPAPGRRVLDLRAGTGKLTRSLVDLGFDVVAVEPELAILAELTHPLNVGVDKVPQPGDDTARHEDSGDLGRGGSHLEPVHGVAGEHRIDRPIAERNDQACSSPWS